MNIVLISHNFPPIQHSGTFRCESFARYLPEFEIYPVIVTDSEPLNTVQTYATAGVDAIDIDIAETVIRVPWKAYLRRTPAERIMAQIGRAPVLNSAIRALRHRSFLESVGAKIMDRLRDMNCRAILASSPPPETLILAQHLSNHMNIPYICDLRDPWTYFFAAKYRSYLDFKFERHTERNTLMGATYIIANTKTARTQLIDQVGIKSKKIIVIPNGYDELYSHQGNNLNCFHNDKFNIVYSGLLSDCPSEKNILNITRLKYIIKMTLGLEFHPMHVDTSTRSPKYFLEGLHAAISNNRDMRDSIRCHFIGEFSENVINHLMLFPYPETIVIHRPVDQKIANAMCAEADLLLLLQIAMYRNEADFCTAVPGKLYNYLRSGTPILAPMQNGDAADMIRELNAGYVVSPKDIAAIAGVIQKSVSNWRAGGSDKVDVANGGLRRFERRSLTAEMAEALKSAVRMHNGLERKASTGS